ITPILSIVKTVLSTQPDANFTLVYGNRSWQQTMFSEQIMDLKDRFRTRLQLVNIFSREISESDLFNGRIDADKLQQLFDAQLISADVDHCFACGPEEMMEAVETRSEAHTSELQS